ncbi:MAG: translocation/assembly module TamB domain-containing protein, partial [Armatimonadota bacterium]|nr:translocation/assembly module TamB domain-containing protein [Armatimonadota bacterium]
RFLRLFPAAAPVAAYVGRLPEPLTGRVSARARLSGNRERPRVDLDVDATQLTLGPYTLARVTGDLGVYPGTFVLSNVEAHANGGILRANGTVGQGGAIDLTLAGTNLTLAAIRPVASGVGPLNGHAEVNAQVLGTLKAPQVKGSLEIRDASVGGMRFQHISAQQVRISEGRLHLGRLVFTGGPIQGSVSGWMPFGWRPLGIPIGEPIQLSVLVPAQEVTLPPTPALGLTGASAQVSGALAVGGTLQHPDLSGEVTIREGRARFAMLENTFTGVNASLRMAGPAVIVEELTGKSDRGGGFRAWGTATLGDDGARVLDLAVTTGGGSGLELAFRNMGGVPGLHAAGAFHTTTRGAEAGAVTITGPLRQPLITGQLQLSRAQVAVPNEMRFRPRTRPLTVNPALNLEVVTADGAAVRRGRGLSAVLTGSMVARGTLQEPNVGGRVVVERGDLYYAGTHFRLQPGGTLSFSADPPAPLTTRLDVYALTRVRTRSQNTGERRLYNVTMHLSGTL